MPVYCQQYSLNENSMAQEVLKSIPCATLFFPDVITFYLAAVLQQRHRSLSSTSGHKAHTEGSCLMSK